MRELQNLSVCVPLFRRSQYIRGLIDSIPFNVPIFVSDNGGEVSAQGVFFGGNVTLTQPAGDRVVGPFENWNAALQNSASEWVLIPGDDDEYLPDAFNNIIFPALEKALDSAMIIFGHQEIDQWGVAGRTWCPASTVLDEPDLAFDKLKYGVEARMPSIAFRLSTLRSVGGFDESFKITAGDSELIQRLAMNYKVLFVSQIVSRYRVWVGNDTSAYIKSAGWHAEIKCWMEKLKSNLSHSGLEISKAKVLHIQHEVILRNYISSMAGRDGFFRTFEVLLNGVYPFMATPRAHLICALLLIKSLVRKV